MKGIDIEFRNRPNEDGTLSTFTVKDCLVAQNGNPTTSKPQILIHLPKADRAKVGGAWVEYDDSTYHVIGATAPSIQENTPTRWDRYCIAEKPF